MRLVKLILGAGLLAALVAMGTNRHPVLAAYQTSDEQPAAVVFSGLDLGTQLTPMGVSPYVVDPAPDTRDATIGLTVHPRPSTALTMSGGSSLLSGTVTGPNGAVAGASVRIERAVGDGLAVAELVTDDLGAYTLPAILGGRYRIRAWLGGSFTTTTSEVLFLDAGEARTVDVVVAQVETQPQLGFTHRGDIFVGLTGSVAVSVTTRSVGADGLVDLNGVSGARVTLAPSANVTANAFEVAADGSGVARFLIECYQPGPASAVITYDGRRATATLPNCRPLPTVVPPAPGEPEGQPPTVPAVPRDLVHETLTTETVGTETVTTDTLSSETVGINQ